MNRMIKTKLVVLYNEDKEVLKKIEDENVNFGRLVRSLLLKWYLDGLKDTK